MTNEELKKIRAQTKIVLGRMEHDDIGFVLRNIFKLVEYAATRCVVNDMAERAKEADSIAEDLHSKIPNAETIAAMDDPESLPFDVNTLTDPIAFFAAAGAGLATDTSTPTQDDMLAHIKAEPERKYGQDHYMNAITVDALRTALVDEQPSLPHEPFTMNVDLSAPHGERIAVHYNFEPLVDKVVITPKSDIPQNNEPDDFRLDAARMIMGVDPAEEGSDKTVIVMRSATGEGFRIFDCGETFKDVCEYLDGIETSGDEAEKTMAEEFVDDIEECIEKSEIFNEPDESGYREYKCHKIVHALPCTAWQHFGHTSRPVPDGIAGNAPGYQVVYDMGGEDEYKSWSPRKQFEAGYTATSTRGVGNYNDERRDALAAEYAKPQSLYQAVSSLLRDANGKGLSVSHFEMSPSDVHYMKMSKDFNENFYPTHGKLESVPTTLNGVSVTEHSAHTNGRLLLRAVNPDSYAIALFSFNAE